MSYEYMVLYEHAMVEWGRAKGATAKVNIEDSLTLMSVRGWDLVSHDGSSYIFRRRLGRWWRRVLTKAAER